VVAGGVAGTGPLRAAEGREEELAVIHSTHVISVNTDTNEESMKSGVEL